MTNPMLPARARTAGRIVVWILLVVLVLLTGAAVWLGVRGVLAYGHLRAAQSAADGITADLSDPESAARAISGISQETDAARTLTSDPIWQAASGLPWIGDQLGAVATVTAAVDDVTADALTPLIDVATDFTSSGLRPEDGRIDLAAFPTMARTAAESANVTGLAVAAVGEIDRGALLPPVAEAVDQVSRLLTTADGAADAVARATELMPPMLGADGPRDYLVVFQNNAEWRSLGGIVGATAVIHTDGGALSLTAQASSTDFPRGADPVIDIGADLTQFMDTRPARFIQNATQVPSFPVAAQIAQAMWAQKSGAHVDGVIALDPVTLSYMLRATGPVTLPTGDVMTSDNAVSLLLNEAYLRYERPAEQDAFFQSAAAAVFATLAGGGADPVELVKALTQAGEERRLLVWNADADEQAVLDGTSLQGMLPQTDADTTSFGVYLNDGTGSKMDYYMGVETGAAWCGTDAVLSVTLRSNAPADAAGLPRYITGGGAFGVPAGIAQTVSYLYMPAGAEVIASSSVGGTVPEVGFGAGVDQGRSVLVWTVDLAPGESATATVRVRTPQTPALNVEMTPVLPGAAATVPAACS